MEQISFVALWVFRINQKILISAGSMTAAMRMDRLPEEQRGQMDPMIWAEEERMSLSIGEVRICYLAVDFRVDLIILAALELQMRAKTAPGLAKAETR